MMLLAAGSFIACGPIIFLLATQNHQISASRGSKYASLGVFLNALESERGWQTKH
jgi:hypothetical protein